MDGDGDLDLAAGNDGQPNRIYLNEGGQLQTTAAWSSTESDLTSSIAWGDADGDGDLDLAVGNGSFFGFEWGAGQPNRVYLNEKGQLQTTATWSSTESDLTSSIAWGDVDGDGNLDLAVGNNSPSGRIYLNLKPALFPDRQPLALALHLTSDPAPTFNGQVSTALAPANFYAMPTIRQARVIPITYALFHPANVPLGTIRAYYTLDGAFPSDRSRWRVAQPLATAHTLALAPTAAPPSWASAAHLAIFPLVLKNGALDTHVFAWDVWGSGFFGQSDNVVVRIEALPDLKPRPNSAPGPFQRPLVAAQTFPFRVRGTQIRVVQEGPAAQPAAGAIVYRLEQDTTVLAQPYRDLGDRIYSTNDQGYLQGRGTLQAGDRLIALWPLTHTASYTVYHTNATPVLTDLQAYTVTNQGV